MYVYIFLLVGIHYLADVSWEGDEGGALATANEILLIELDSRNMLGRFPWARARKLAILYFFHCIYYHFFNIFFMYFIFICNKLSAFAILSGYLERCFSMRVFFTSLGELVFRTCLFYPGADIYSNRVASMKKYFKSTLFILVDFLLLQTGRMDNWPCSRITHYYTNENKCLSLFLFFLE